MLRSYDGKRSKNVAFIQRTEVGRFDGESAFPLSGCQRGDRSVAVVDKAAYPPSTNSKAMEIANQTGVSTAESAQPSPAPTQHPQVPASSSEEHDSGLLLVGLFKLSKAVFFGAVGAGALQLVHRNIGDLAMRIIEILHRDPDGRFAAMLMDKADLIGGHQLRQGALLSFLYAALCVVEGTGLMLKKGWAEYFTVVLTAGAMPVESYELWEKFEWYKVALLLVNIAVLLYLLWVLKRKRQGAGQSSLETA